MRYLPQGFDPAKIDGTECSLQNLQKGTNEVAVICEHCGHLSHYPLSCATCALVYQVRELTDQLESVTMKIKALESWADQR